MNKMKKHLLYIFLISILFGPKAYSINYISANTGPSDWMNAASWSPNGIPTIDDNVTIASGHTINISSAGAYCNSLTLEGTLNWTAIVTLTINGNYSILAGGSESGVAGQIQMNGRTGSTFTCNGTTASNVNMSFRRSYTITAGSVVNKVNATTFIINAGTVITNLGTYRIGLCDARSGTSWINGVNSVLNITRDGFMLNRTFNATATGNIVNLNYANGNVPRATGYYILNLNGSGTKLLLGGTTIASNFTIGANRTLNTNNFNLNLGGDFTINGTFIHSAGRFLRFNGTSAAQTLSISTGVAQRLNNVVINNSNGVSVGNGAFHIIESLTATAGIFNSGSGSVTLVSNSSGTARIGITGATGGYAGSNFIIQRFISARNEGWGDLAPTVSSTTVLDWDNEIYMSGVGGADGNATTAGGTIFRSLYRYRESDARYIAITSTGATLTNGRGYELWLAADETSMNDTTLDSRGTPVTGTRSISISYTASSPDPGCNLVGNPFASFIAWDNVTKPNIDEFYYIFDNGTGNYATYGAGTVIPPGQGFYVYANNSSASLSIPESAKTNSNASTLLRTAPKGLTLKISSGLNKYVHKSLLRIHENAGNPAADARFKKSPFPESPSITFAGDNRKLSIKSISGNESSLTLPLKTQVGLQGVYTIEAKDVNALQEYSCIVLEDKQTKNLVDLTQLTKYSFEASPEDDENRFVLHLNKASDECERTMTSASSIVNSNTNAQIINSDAGVYIQFNNIEAGTEAMVSITNLLGQQVMENYRITTTNDPLKLDLPAQLKGVHFISIQLNNKVVTGKVFLNKANN